MKRAIWLCLAAAWIAPWSARSAYLDPDGPPEPAVRSPDRPFVPPRPPPGGADNELTQLVRELRIGHTHRYRGLTIYPVLRDGGGGDMAEVRTLDEALRAGSLDVDEKASADVGTLRVRNRSGNPVFLMSGEILAGGKQNRIVRDDVLLPPESGDVAVPVYCGERDRWSAAPEAGFRSAQSLAAPSLRADAAAGEPQDAIWRRIAEHSDKAGVSSPTRDYQRIYDDPDVRRQLDDCAAAFRDFRGGRTVGAVAFHGARILGADVFSDARLFERLWAKALRAYSLECVAGGWKERPWGDEGSAREFLDRVLHARFNDEYTPGMGTLRVIRGGVNGKSLAWRGAVVHAGLYAADRIEPQPVPLPGPRPPHWPPHWPPWRDAQPMWR